MTNFLKQKKSAFTLIELLVVIAIIGILSTLAVVALQNARSKARDSKRVADVKQIQTALELYFNDNGLGSPILATRDYYSWLYLKNIGEYLVLTKTPNGIIMN